MKKATKIIIPILLVLAIIVCSAWYLFIYDREFTRDALLTVARMFEGEGNHTAAQWMYKLAYLQDNDNDAVAIELSQQYKDNGNYTKAEYTLYNAIQDGGGINLYIALSKLYVEQDKLLDAANLLNNVTGQVKKDLESKRPALPTVSQNPGFYSQYISVSIETSSGTLYANTSNQYPSTLKDKYSAPFTLVEGENTIYAIAVNELGLVSPLAIYRYTIGGVIEEVEFNDQAMEDAVRTLLNSSNSTTLYSNDLWDITEFTVPADAQDYRALKHMTSLEKLSICDGAANQLSHISGMSDLRELGITNTPISDDELQIIGNLGKLEKLVLSNCSLSTISALSDLTSLTYLDLSNNTLRDITAISSMNGLTELYLQANVLTSIDSLSSCKELIKLNVSHNSLDSLSPVYSTTSITWLDASQNAISSIDGIAGLTKLSNLYLSHNKLSDLSSVANCTFLKELAVASNQLENITSLSALNELQFLDFSHNLVIDLPVWDKSSKLVTIDGSYNKIKSLDSLSGLNYLNNVYMDYNENISSVAALAACHRLIRVNVYGTKVKDVSMLTEMSVIVNYDPTKK